MYWRCPLGIFVLEVSLRNHQIGIVFQTMGLDKSPRSKKRQKERVFWTSVGHARVQREAEDEELANETEEIAVFSRRSGYCGVTNDKRKESFQ